MFNRLNTHAVGGAGLLLGGGTIISSVVAFFKLLSDPTYIDALFVAVMHARKHALDPADVFTYAQLTAVCIAIIGAIVVAFLLCYFGRPRTVASDGSPSLTFGMPRDVAASTANANDAAQASKPPP